MRPNHRNTPPAALLLLTLTCPLALQAAVPLERPPRVAGLEHRDPRLALREPAHRIDELPAAAARDARRRLGRLGVPAEHARLDLRTGRWRTLILSRPLVPGSGIGNDPARDGGPPPAGAGLEARVWDAFAAFLEARRGALRLDPAEMPRPGRVTVHDAGDLVQIWAPRVVAGTPVRDSYVTAVVNHGNLVLLGARNWGDLDGVPAARLTVEEAGAAVADHLGTLAAGTVWRRPALELVPLALGTDPATSPSRGLAHRPAWVLHPQIAGDPGRWEALVDAVSGELLSFVDTNRYAADGFFGATCRRVQGGVYPVSNDGEPPDGVEQPGWPMPFDRVTTVGGGVATDTGGNLPAPVAGTISSQLDGTYVRMDDTCGPVDLASEGDLDFGVSGGTDCVTPGFGGPGNTHSSRTGFYVLNRIIEQARAHLPENDWLSSQLTAEVNVELSCAAFWNGERVTMSQSSGLCANPGEQAMIYHHEWGHGLDDNDAVPGVSNPSEGIPDVYAALHENVSCIARGFFSGNCGGYGDPCTDCTGVRDIDWAKRQSGEPHDLDWIDANCPFGGFAPCGGIVHCEGAVVSEAVWDLATRTLRAPPYSFDADTALEAATRLTFVGAGGVGTWYQCSPPFGGCGADGGYLNYLAADDDNGDIADGTPHMTAIFRAFDLHQIACDTPVLAPCMEGAEPGMAGLWAQRPAGSSAGASTYP